jgi:hypothetical protein
VDARERGTHTTVPPGGRPPIKTLALAWSAHARCAAHLSPLTLPDHTFPSHSYPPPPPPPHKPTPPKTRKKPTPAGGAAKASSPPKKAVAPPAAPKVPAANGGANGGGAGSPSRTSLTAGH